MADDGRHIGFRVFQGLGAAMTQRRGCSHHNGGLPSQERGRVLGISGGIVAIGLAMGPAIGGLTIGLPHEAIGAAVAGTYRTAALFGLVVVILAWSSLKLGRRNTNGIGTE